jgi:membrane protease YdiL (CAAX protease family)
MTARLPLLLSLVWWVAFALGQARGAVHAFLAPIAVVVVGIVVARAPAAARAQWSGRSAGRATLFGDAVVGLVVGGASLVCTHLAFPPLAAALPSLGAEIAALYALAGVTTLMTGAATVIVALAEELLWRGALATALPPHWSAARRVVVVAVLYGLAQSGGRSAWLVVAAVALGACWHVLARLRGGRLCAPAVAHLVWTLGVLGAWPLPRGP